MPHSEKVGEYLCDVPAGALRRQPRNQDVPCLRYCAAVRSDGSALALMPDSKYGYRATEEALSVSLINTSCYPDPFPDRGLHTVNIALAVGRDDPRELEDNAGFYNHPAYFCSGWSHPGELPMNDSFLELEAASTVLSAVLPTGNRDTILVRYYETAGQDDHIALHFGRTPVSAAATDLSGCWADSNAAIVGDTVLVTAKAHSIGQLRITF